MDVNQTSAQTEGTNGLNSTAKHSRIKKLNADEIEGLPGVIPRAVKVEATEDTYSIVFNFKLQNEIGTIDEATRCFLFANSLDQHAKAKSVGKVTAARFDNGGYEAVLTLNVNDKPSNNSVPLKNAFSQLGDYFGKADILRTGVAGTPGTWKAKVRNTTIVEGHF